MADHSLHSSSETLSPLGTLEAEFIKNELKSAIGVADDGEVYFERSESEALFYDDNRLKSASYNADQGFGLRVVAGETTGFATSSRLTKDALSRAAKAAALAKDGNDASTVLDKTPPQKTQHRPYAPIQTMGELGFKAKSDWLELINETARALDPRVVQVSASVIVEQRDICIVRLDQDLITDHRPLVRLNISISVEENGRRETAGVGSGGRYSLSTLYESGHWQGQIREALRQALVNLKAVDAPTGEMDVVLGAGWPGVLLHEAVGHGLEGDFNRKGTSAFSGLMGKQVASRGVTVIDDGTIPNRRGSLTTDDEGTPTSRTVLIDDGILVGYMHDRLSARLMQAKATGNGRRQSFAYQPMPRMTNTFMLGGKESQEDMIKQTKSGLFAVNFGGGQVDITSGNFVFQCTEAYLIEDGKVTRSVKGATLIGDGPSVMKKIDMIGDDFAFDPGVGTCGKAGQGVPVGIGQPSLRIRGITVGGTAVA